MKATWKPQTKKPVVSSAYPRCPNASRRAAGSDCPAAGSSPRTAGEPGSTKASGAISSAEAARNASAACHPAAEMNACPSGEKTTCPADPAAVPNPSASERRPGPTTFAMAARARENAVHATPTPTRTPAVRCSAPALSADAIPQMPAA